MKNIITAIGNINLNMELKKDIYFNVVSQDIQYQEGIFELLEQKNDIDFLVVSENIPGELEFLELIKKIIKVNAKINIYVILEEKNAQIKNELNNMKIRNIFYSNQIEIKELITYLKNDQKPDEEKLKEEIEKLKELILKNNISNNVENSDEPKKKIKNSKKVVSNVENNVLEIEKNEEILSICIAGVHGSGKSIITLLIAKYYETQSKRVLVIDADIYNQSIHTILGTKVKNNNDEKIFNLNKKISVFSDINDFLESDKSLKIDRFNRFLNHIKNEYDILLIDTSCNLENEYIKKILRLSNKMIFLVEPNLSEVSKSQNLLDYYVNKLNINREKINIILNKTNKNMIDENILKNLFFNIRIIGKIEYGGIFAECINTNKIKCLDNKKLLKSCNLNFK